jgi:glycosyltransferase involved in cell wall biosynthesis
MRTSPIIHNMNLRKALNQIEDTDQVIKGLVSVGLPVMNGSHTIAFAIERLLGQSFKNIEIIISDNFSSDETLSIVTKIAKVDSRIRILTSDKNRGSIWNFNRVLLEAKGEFFMWAAHDDYHEKDFIKNCLEILLKKNNAVLCMPEVQMKIQGSDKLVWSANFKSFDNLENPVERFGHALRTLPSVSMYGLFRKNALLKSGGIHSIVGGDIIGIQALALLGNFVSCEEHLFTRVSRIEWNSGNQDIAVFLGEQKRINRLYILPKLFFAQWKIAFQKEFTYSFRFSLSVVLFKYQLREIVSKVLLHIYKRILPKKMQIRFASNFYNLLFANPNFTPKDKALFFNRIILPTLRLQIPNGKVDSLL